MGHQPNIQESLVGKDAPLLLFDGVCNLCNNTVKFIIKNDKSQSIHFAPLQSEIGQAYIKKSGLPTEELKSLIFIDKGNIHIRSSGALHISKYLGFPWKMAYVFLIIPTFLRDFCYNFIAKNRYRWFGKQEECMIPSPEIKARFVS